MRPTLFALFLLTPLLARADIIKLTPAHSAQAGIVTLAQAELRTSASVQLPAQVVVPPAQIEVLAAPLPALVAKVQVAYGESVKRGQLLARLQGAALVELQRDFASARATATLTAESLRRDESLYADGIIAQSRLSATRAAEQQAALALAEKRQTLQLAGLSEAPGTATLPGTSGVRAPFDGVVLEAHAQVGSRVDAMTPLFKLGRLSPLWLEIQASASQAAGLATGDTVTVPGCAAPARITLIAPHLQMASQSLLIRAELAKPAGCVKPFQYVQVAVTPARLPAAGAMQLPAAAVTRHQGKAWIFVTMPDGFQPLEVSVHSESASGFTVSTVADALPAEARVAVKGLATLKAVWLGLGAGE